MENKATMLEEKLRLINLCILKHMNLAKFIQDVFH